VLAGADCLSADRGPTNTLGIAAAAAQQGLRTEELILLGIGELLPNNDVEHRLAEKGPLLAAGSTSIVEVVGAVEGGGAAETSRGPTAAPSACEARGGSSSSTTPAAPGGVESVASGSGSTLGHIRVAVRVRPLPKAERGIIEVSAEGRIAIRKEAATGGNVYLSSQQGRTEERTFDRVFGPEVTQAEVYLWSCQPLITAAVQDGRSSTIFVYGATGAGKTHTMFGERDEAQQGLIYRAVRDVFRAVGDRGCVAPPLEVKVSFLELYNEKVRDLLQPTQEGSGGGSFGACSIMEDERQGVVRILNLREEPADSAEEALQQLHLGLQLRKVESTAANSRSSRSHAVFTLRLESVEEATRRPHSRVCLIDLAGSERAAQTQNVGASLRDGAKINQSLLALANCIDALGGSRAGARSSSSTAVAGTAEGQKDAKVLQPVPRKPPYRDSKLTLLLKSSFVTDGLVSMIANLHPGRGHFEDSNNTLEYAKRLSTIKAPVVVRLDRDSRGAEGREREGSVPLGLRPQPHRPSLGQSAAAASGCRTPLRERGGGAVGGAGGSASAGSGGRQRGGGTGGGAGGGSVGGGAIMTPSAGSLASPLPAARVAVDGGVAAAALPARHQSKEGGGGGGLGGASGGPLSLVSPGSLGGAFSLRIGGSRDSSDASSGVASAAANSASSPRSRSWTPPPQLLRAIGTTSVFQRSPPGAAPMRPRSREPAAVGAAAVVVGATPAVSTGVRSSTPTAAAARPRHHSVGGAGRASVVVGSNGTHPPAVLLRIIESLRSEKVALHELLCKAATERGVLEAECARLRAVNLEKDRQLAALLLVDGCSAAGGASKPGSFVGSPPQRPPLR